MTGWEKCIWCGEPTLHDTDGCSPPECNECEHDLDQLGSAVRFMLDKLRRRVEDLEKRK